MTKRSFLHAAVLKTGSFCDFKSHFHFSAVNTNFVAQSPEKSGFDLVFWNPGDVVATALLSESSFNPRARTGRDCFSLTCYGTIVYVLNFAILFLFRFFIFAETPNLFFSFFSNCYPPSDIIHALVSAGYNINGSSIFSIIPFP